MSSVAAPFGLRPIGRLDNGSLEVFRQYPIASAYNTNIAMGDIVQLVDGGAATTIEKQSATGDDTTAIDMVGVFMGCKYTDPNLGYELYSQSYPAGTVASDIEAYVADATELLFKAAVVSSGTTIGDLAITDIGANVAGVDNTGDSTSGNSRGAISDTSATTATLPFRIIGLVEETKNSSGGYTEAYVKWNAGHQYNNTTGV